MQRSLAARPYRFGGVHEMTTRTWNGILGAFPSDLPHTLCYLSCKCPYAFAVRVVGDVAM